MKELPVTAQAPNGRELGKVRSSADRHVIEALHASGHPAFSADSDSPPTVMTIGSIARNRFAVGGGVRIRS
jgi:hypothetical protein